MGRYGQGIFGTGQYGENDDTVLAGVTHHIVLNTLGLMLGGVASRSDITSSIPRVSVGTDQKKHTDFSERDTFGQDTWHHGRGARDDYDDPATFFESFDMVTWVPGQLTLRPKYYTRSVDPAAQVLHLNHKYGRCRFER